MLFFFSLKSFVIIIRRKIYSKLRFQKTLQFNIVVYGWLKKKELEIGTTFFGNN